VKRNNRDLSAANRRQYVRLKPAAVPFLKSVAFNQGFEAQVVNISRGGILLETDVRLRPQMKILLKLVTTEGVIKMEGQIIRSSISSLNGVPRYQSAISFEHPFHMLDDLSAELEEQKQESLPESTMLSEIDAANETPRMELIPGSILAGDSAVLTVIAQDGMSMQDMFELNDW
jgi:PilZ domain